MYEETEDVVQEKGAQKLEAVQAAQEDIRATAQEAQEAQMALIEERKQKDEEAAQRMTNMAIIGAAFQGTAALVQGFSGIAGAVGGN